MPDDIFESLNWQPLSAFAAAASAAMSDEDFIALCQEGTSKEIEAAIKAGANVNAKDNDGATALMLAAHNDMGFNLECFLLLLDNGADPQLTNPKSKEAIDHMLSELSDEEREMALARLAEGGGQ